MCLNIAYASENAVAPQAHRREKEMAAIAAGHQDPDLEEENGLHAVAWNPFLTGSGPQNRACMVVKP
jgi:hypothetical protein